MKLIERKKYLSSLVSVIGSPDIKVITGIRRCGKSKLMEALMDYLRTSYEDANIIHVNFSSLEFEHLILGGSLIPLCTIGVQKHGLWTDV